MKKKLFLMLLFVALMMACAKETLIELPVADPYRVSITGISLAEKLEFFVDGKLASLSPSQNQKFFKTFLKSKGKRKLEVREAGKDKVIHTISFRRDTTVTFYWNGEEISDKIKLKKPTPAHYGVLLQLDTIAASNTKGPVDIEIYYLNRRYATTDFNGGNPIHVIKNYTFTEIAPYFELSEALIKSKGRYDKLYFRLCKPGTQEDYYPHTVAGETYAFGNWAKKLGKEYWTSLAIDTYIVLDKTIMFKFKQKVDEVTEGLPLYERLSPYGIKKVVFWRDPLIVVGD